MSIYIDKYLYMQKKITTTKAVSKSKEYIKAKASGMSKRDALIYAGYSESTARVPNIMEKTAGYQIALQQIIASNAETLNMSTQQFTQRVLAGELNLTTMKDHADILTKLVKVHDTLNPKVKVEQDSDGNTKATKWMTIKD